MNESKTKADELNRIGSELADEGEFGKAKDVFRSALAMHPSHVGALYNLGSMLSILGDLRGALACCDGLLARLPGEARLHQHRGNLLSALTRHEEAMASLNTAIRLSPDDLSTHSDRLLAQNYFPVSREERFRSHLEFGERFEERVPVAAWSPRVAGSRKLRVGYVSSDLRNHAVAYFLKGVLPLHDREGFAVFYYSGSSRRDSITRRFEENCDGWRETAGVSDEALARQVLEDEIDVLVDLSGHTQGNRLGVFMRKPAPIQLTWFGYLGTTGLSRMDYKFADESLCPEGSQKFYTEEIFLLPRSLAYDPPDAEGVPEVTPLPAATRGFVTFGAVNNPRKSGARVVSRWAEILNAVPSSRFVLAGLDEQSWERIRAELARAGIPPGRVDAFGVEPLPVFLSRIASVDIALDPFPHGGGATTAHSLWMGVPVVAWEGESEFERISASLLKRAGLRDWVARSEAEMVEIAVSRARPEGFARVAEIRRGLRPRMAAENPSHRIIREIERAYVQLAERKGLRPIQSVTLP